MPESTLKDYEIDYRKKVKGTINKAVTIFSAGEVISPRRTGQLSPRSLFKVKDNVHHSLQLFLKFIFTIVKFFDLCQKNLLTDAEGSGRVLQNQYLCLSFLVFFRAQLRNCTEILCRQLSMNYTVCIVYGSGVYLQIMELHISRRPRFAVDEIGSAPSPPLLTQS
jgi:hypothetical protein